MGQTSISFESMSSIMQEKTHKKRPYGSLGTPPIPALPGFPKNPLHSILQYHPRVSSSYCQARLFFFPLMKWATGSSIMDPLYPWFLDHFPHGISQLPSILLPNTIVNIDAPRFNIHKGIELISDVMVNWLLIFWILDKYIKLNTTATETSSLIL